MTGDLKKVTETGITPVSRYQNPQSSEISTSNKDVYPEVRKGASKIDVSKRQGRVDPHRNRISRPLLWTKKLGKGNKKVTKKNQKTESRKLKGSKNLSHRLLEISDSLVTNVLKGFLRSLLGFEGF